ncbi:nitronate monooxygenase [Streptomyces sp. NPDC014724]|uniref:nitronate monooxygenase n=1 Tax=unclassified Streptomyces TaxID=2593676 RepID=UPI0037014F57
MALSTAFTKLFGVQHPIASAPMGGSAGGTLAAAVSRGGGLGLLGGGYGDDRDWLDRELAIVAGGGKPWGVGFLSWAVGVDAVEQALEYGPAAVTLSFGDPTPFVERIRAAGASVIVQVTDLEEARQAVDLRADVIVAQGSESGGHGARHGRATLPFVPVVVDLAAPVPVLAAGGIADGRGVAAALALGAAGALVGTRFQATAESLVDPSIAETIVRGRGEDTERNGVLDIAGELDDRTRNTRLAPSAIPTSTAGGAGRTNSPRTPAPAMAIRPMWHAALCPRCRCGPARASTSSSTCHPQPIWSPRWPPRPTGPSPEQEGTDWTPRSDGCRSRPARSRRLRAGRCLRSPPSVSEPAS